jgi:eukaryotic-like serine/threonine-protein kinase
MEINSIIEDLSRKTALLNDLDSNEIVSVLKCCKSHSFADSETIYAEGSKGDNLFIILNGSVSIKKNGKPVDVMREGYCFGEIGAVSTETRIYTTVAHGDVLALGIQGALLDSLENETHIKVLKNILYIISERFHKRLT